MDTITMWATMSSLGADARYERPLHTTSQPVDVANGTNVPEVAHTRTVIQSFDIAKIRKDSEDAIIKDEILNKFNKNTAEHRVDVRTVDLSTVFAGEITRQDVERAMDSHLVKSWLKAKNSNELLKDVEKSHLPGEKLLDNSQILTEKGEPMVFYYGTNRAFDEFDLSKSAGMGKYNFLEKNLELSKLFTNFAAELS